MLKGRDRILLHLYELGDDYTHDRSSFSYFPFVLCQEGISDVVGLSRNRTSTLVKELDDERLIRKESRRVIEGEQKRFVYFLDEEGRERAEEVKKEIESKRISVRTEKGVFETELKNIGNYLKGPGNLLLAYKNLDDNDHLDLLNLGKQDYFVDREEVIELLKEKIDLTRREENEGENFLIITGPPGVGKTKLADGVKDYAEKEDEEGVKVAFLQERCYKDNKEPYGVFYRCLSKFFEEDEASKYFDIEKPDVFDQLEMKYRKGEENENDPSNEKKKFFQEFADDLKNVSDGLPLMFFFDDIDRADKDTLEFLLFLAENLEDGSIHFILTYREEDTDSDEIIEMLQELKDAKSSTFRELKPFNWKATRKLVTERIGRKVIPDEFIDICHQISDGLPLFIEAYLDEVLKKGALDPIKGRYPTSRETIDFPDRIMTLYKEKLEPLNEEERDILDVCSCFKKEIPFALLVELIDCDKSDLKTLIEKLEDVGLLDIDLDMNLNFSHDMMKLAVKKNIDEEKKQGLHKKIADALSEFFEDELEDHYSELGRHHDRAGRYDEAVKYYKKGAEKAEKDYANEKALGLYKKLLRAQKKVPDTGLSESFLFEKLGDLENRTGELKKGEKYLHKAVERSTDWRDEQRLKRKLSECLRKRGEYDQALKFAEKSLAIIEEKAEGEELKKERCKTLKEKGVILMRKNDFDSSEQIFKEIEEKCVNHLKECGEEEEIDAVRGEALHYLGSIGYYKSDLRRAKIYLQEAIDIRKKVRDLDGLAKSNNNLGVIYRHQQEYDTALRYFEEVNRLKKKTGLKEGDPDALDNMGIIYYDKGELDKALDYHKRCLDIEKKMGDNRGIAASFDNIGIILFEKGKLDESIDHFQRSLRLKDEMENKTGMGLSHYNLGRSYEEKGELDRAIDHLNKSLKIRRDNELRLHEAESELEIGIINMEKGELEKSEQYLNQALDIFKKIENDLGIGMTLTYLGKLDLLKGNMDKAKVYLEHSENIGFRFEDMKYSIISNRHLAEFYLEDGDSEKAHQHIKEALKLALKMDSKNQIGKCRHLKGRIYFTDDHWYQADKGYRRALNIFEETGSEKEKAKVLLDWSLLLKKIGEKEDAAKNLEIAIDLFEKCGIENWCSLVRGVSPLGILEELEEDL